MKAITSSPLVVSAANRTFHAISATENKFHLKTLKNKGKIACQAPIPSNSINPNHLAVAFKLLQSLYT
jgi:hypothetical protein